MMRRMERAAVLWTTIVPIVLLVVVLGLLCGQLVRQAETIRRLGEEIEALRLEIPDPRAGQQSERETWR